ncbi:hypothetical protein VULLAG_LOCUS7298 [Vulpes lagopus]
MMCPACDRRSVGSRASCLPSRSLFVIVNPLGSVPPPWAPPSPRSVTPPPLNLLHPTPGRVTSSSAASQISTQRPPLPEEGLLCTHLCGSRGPGKQPDLP